MFRTIKILSGVNRLKNADPSSSWLAWFSYQFATSLKAGLSISECLYLAAENDNRQKKSLVSIAEQVEMGTNLHKALMDQNLFPGYFISMIKIGEKSGTLDKVMDALAAYYERDDNLRYEIKDALMYPLILICIVSFIILLVTSKILPIFNQILGSAGSEMPVIAKVLMRAGLFVSNNLLNLFISILAALLIFCFWKSTPTGKMNIAKFKVQTKLFGGIFLKMYMAQICTAMWYVLKSGLDIDIALEMTSEVVHNKYMAKSILTVRQTIQEGTDISDSFDSIDVFPAQFIKMLKIGHKTGDLSGLAQKASALYQKQVDRILHRIVSSIEPILAAILSVVIGMVLIAVMLPLMRLMLSMK